MLPSEVLANVLFTNLPISHCCLWQRIINLKIYPIWAQINKIGTHDVIKQEVSPSTFFFFFYIHKCVVTLLNFTSDDTTNNTQQFVNSQRNIWGFSWNHSASAGNLHVFTYVCLWFIHSYKILYYWLLSNVSLHNMSRISKELKRLEKH